MTGQQQQNYRRPVSLTRIRSAPASLSQFILLAFLAFICLSSDDTSYFLKHNIIPGADAALAIRVNATMEPVNFRSWDPFQGEADHYTLSGLLIMGNVMPDCTIQVNPAAGPSGQLILNAVDPANPIVDSIIVLRYDWLDNCATFDDVSPRLLFSWVVAKLPYSHELFLFFLVVFYEKLCFVFLLFLWAYFIRYCCTHTYTFTHIHISSPRQLNNICLFFECPFYPLHCLSLLTTFSVCPSRVQMYLSMHHASSPCQHAAVCRRSPLFLFIFIPTQYLFVTHCSCHPLHTFFFSFGLAGLEVEKREKRKKERERLKLK